MLNWITHVSSHFVDVQEAFFPFLTAMQSLKFFRLMQVYVWMDRQLINSGIVAWKRFQVSQPTETLSLTNAKQSSRVTHMLTSVCLRQLATFRPTAHTQPIPFEDNAGVVQMVNKGRRANLRHVTRTHIVDLDWLLERVNLDHSILTQYANKRSIGGYVDKAQVHHDAMTMIFFVDFGKSDNSMNQKKSAAFLTNFSLAPLWKAPSSVPGDDTNREV